MTKTGTNLTKHAEKVMIVDVQDSDCFTAWQKSQAEKKAVYQAAKQAYKDLPSVGNWEKMWDACNAYQENSAEKLAAKILNKS